MFTRRTPRAFRSHTQVTLRFEYLSSSVFHVLFQIILLAIYRFRNMVGSVSWSLLKLKSSSRVAACLFSPRLRLDTVILCAVLQISVSCSFLSSALSDQMFETSTIDSEALTVRPQVLCLRGQRSTHVRSYSQNENIPTALWIFLLTPERY